MSDVHNAPGPWKFLRYGLVTEDRPRGNFCTVWSADMQRQIATFGNEITDPEIADADARLAAAAPELLEASQELLATIWSEPPDGDPTINKLRAAIAKATGDA